jgi:hypothetical protein
LFFVLKTYFAVSLPNFGAIALPGESNGPRPEPVFAGTTDPGSSVLRKLEMKSMKKTITAVTPMSTIRLEVWADRRGGGRMKRERASFAVEVLDVRWFICCSQCPWTGVSRMGVSTSAGNW